MPRLKYGFHLYEGSWISNFHSWGSRLIFEPSRSDESLNDIKIVSRPQLKRIVNYQSSRWGWTSRGWRSPAHHPGRQIKNCRCQVSYVWNSYFTQYGDILVLQDSCTPPKRVDRILAYIIPNSSPEKQLGEGVKPYFSPCQRQWQPPPPPSESLLTAHVGYTNTVNKSVHRCN